MPRHFERWEPEQFESLNLEFDDSSHNYYVRGLSYTSVTTVVKTFSRPFNSEKVASSCAVKRKTSATALMKKWENKGLHAANLGNFVHATAEQIALEAHENRQVILPALTQSSAVGYVQAVYRFYQDHDDLLSGWTIPEQKVYSSQYQIAGTVDLLCWLDGVPTILDWKTSEFFKATSYEKMYAPLNQLYDANVIHYALQLSTYAKILRECYGYDADQLVLVQLFPSGRYRKLVVPEFVVAIEKMLQRYQKKILCSNSERIKIPASSEVSPGK